MSAQPRLVVSAPSSGHGKTAIAVGLLAACAARGIPSAGFKVGPDYTDAAYLGLAAGRPGRNLDPRLVGAQRIAPLFAHGCAGAQLSVIEGAMGLFDSLTGQPEIDGTAAVAATLRAPVVLVVDVAAMGHSLAALVHGFRMFDEMVHLGGVILNRVASPRHEQMLRTALDDIGMPVLGAVRRGDLPNVLPARAHGPVPVAHRTVEASRAVRRLGESVAASLDMDRIMALAGSAPALAGPIWTPGDALGTPAFEQRPVVALAGGSGAPFTYVEAAELLTAAGADVAVVDPLRDEALPPGTRALVVGAGLPEGYAEELSANRRLCNAVAQFARDGWPVIAEGVALPWLGRDFDGRPMCGVLDSTATTGEQTVAGYREAIAPTTSALAPAGARITGYKQHRAVVTPRAGAVPAWTWSGGNPEGFVWRQVHASQLGLHWAAAPEIARRLVAAAIAGPAGSSGPGGASGTGSSGPGPVGSSGDDFDEAGGTTQAMPPVHPSVGQAAVGSVGHASHGPGVSGHGPIGVAGQPGGSAPGGPQPSAMPAGVSGAAMSGQGQQGPSVPGGPMVMPAQPVSPGQGGPHARPVVAGQRGTAGVTGRVGAPGSGGHPPVPMQGSAGGPQGPAGVPGLGAMPGSGKTSGPNTLPGTGGMPGTDAQPVPGGMPASGGMRGSAGMAGAGETPGGAGFPGASGMSGPISGRADAVGGSSPAAGFPHPGFVGAPGDSEDPGWFGSTLGAAGRFGSTDEFGRVDEFGGPGRSEYQSEIRQQGQPGRRGQTPGPGQRGGQPDIPGHYGGGRFGTPGQDGPVPLQPQGGMPPQNGHPATAVFSGPTANAGRGAVPQGQPSGPDPADTANIPAP